MQIFPDKKTLPEDIALISDVVGYQNTLALCKTFQGTTVYFPKNISSPTEERNEKIKKEFNGRNYSNLARKYNLTKNRIRQIIRKT